MSLHYITDRIPPGCGDSRGPDAKRIKHGMLGRRDLTNRSTYDPRQHRVIESEILREMGIEISHLYCGRGAPSICRVRILTP